MKRILVQLVILCTTFICTYAQRGRVQIQDGTVVTDRGTLLRGAFVALDNAGDSLPTHEQIRNIRQLGLNTIHVYAENPWDDSVEEAYPGYNMEDLDSLVKWTAEDSLYVVLTMAGWNPQVDSFLYSFWDLYSERYKDETHVIFEICNEPEWADNYDPHIVEMEKNAYDTIRKNAPESHIMMLSYTYNTELDSIIKVLEQLDGYVNWSNTSVALHGYAHGVSEDIRDFNQQILDKGYTLTITEFLSVMDHQYAGMALIRVFEEQHISYLNFLEITHFIDNPEYFKTMIERSEVRWDPDFGTWPESLTGIEYYDPYLVRWGVMYDEGQGWWIGLHHNEIEYVDDNDYAAYYNLNFTESPASFEVMCSSDHGEGEIEIRMDSLNGPVAGVCEISNTGGWDIYRSFTCDITTPVNGVHKVYLVFKETSGGLLFDLRLWYFKKSDLATPQTPYYGEAFQLPGKIEAEEYDIGGQTISFLDMDTVNQGSFFRDDDVDIDSTKDGGYCIGWITASEWVEYTVSCGQETVVDIQFRVACVNTGTAFNVMLNNRLLTTAHLPNTGDYYTWDTITIGNINIPAGADQIIRLEFLDGNFNLDWMNFTEHVSTGIKEQQEVTPIKIYPNPVTEYLTVQSPERGYFEIYSMQGHLLKRKELSAHTNRILLSELSSGSYVIKITYNTQVHSEILIIKDR